MESKNNINIRQGFSSPTLKYLYIFSLIITGCLSPNSSPSKVSCTSVDAKVRQALKEGKIEYIEQYGYGIGLDTSIIVSVSENLPCIPDILQSTELLESELLKIHLALTLIQYGTLKLERYEVIKTISEESTYYLVNGVGWIRPDSNYDVEALDEPKVNIKKLWLGKLK